MRDVHDDVFPQSVRILALHAQQCLPDLSSFIPPEAAGDEQDPGVRLLAENRGIAQGLEMDHVERDQAAAGPGRKGEVLPVALLPMAGLRSREHVEARAS